MRIGIDVSMTADSKTGLPSYARSLVEAMARVDREDEFWLYPITWHSFPLNWREAVHPRARNFKTVCGHWPPRRLLRAWQRGDRKQLLGPPPDVYFSPFHNAPDRWFPRLVCVFHDISFRVYPEFSTEANRVYCEQQFARAARLAHRIVTVSHFSKAEIVRHMGMAPERIEVVHEAADPRYVHRPGSAVPERFRAQLGLPFVLYVGSVEPRKNLATLVDAFAALPAPLRQRSALAIAGGSGWKNSAVYEAVERHGLREQVHLLGFVTDEELVALYNACTVFCYPSLYEGFGLPVAEAMSCGAPVITSRVSSLPEVGGEAVRYVDEPRDAAALSAELREVLEDTGLRERLRALGLAQAATFSWDRAARETLAILRRVVDDPALDPAAVEPGRDERGIEYGFHDLERDGEGSFRWMQREGRLRLLVGQEHHGLQVAASSPLPEGEVTLIASVAGHTTGTALLGHGKRLFTFPLPAGLQRGQLTEVRLNVNRTLPPALKGSDARELGARVFAVALQ
jgi:glycosyltransferase involved in cell wall biosynthesis